MAELYSVKEGRIVNVADSEVEEKVRSQTHDFLSGPNSRIAINTGSGKPTYVPAHTASKYIRSGASYMTPLAVQQMRDNNEFADSALGNVAAVGTGLDEYLFAGAGGHALEALGIVDEGQTEAISALNPYIHHGSGVAASILAALGTAGVSAKGQTALHGTKAATALGAAAVQNVGKATALNAAEKSIARKGFDTVSKNLADYTLPGVGAKIGRFAEDKTHAFLMKHGDNFFPSKIANSELAKRWGPSTAKVMSASIGAGVEGAVWGTGTGISEALVGEPEESAEFLLDSITDNVLIGMAFGGTIAGITPFLAGATGAGANMADTMLDVSGRAGGAALSKAAPMIARIAKNNKYDPKVVSWLKKVVEDGDVEAIQDLDAFVDSLGATAADLGKLFDALIVSEQFRQVSDIQGLNVDVLKDAIDATIQGQNIPHNVGPIFDEDQVLIGLKKRLGEDRLAADAFDDPSVTSFEGLSKTDWIKKIGANKKKIKDRELALRRENRTPNLDKDIVVPPTSQIVLNNVSATFERVRKSLISAKEQVPSTNIKGEEAVSNLLSKVNEVEANLYRQLFSENNYDRLRSLYAEKIRGSRLKVGETKIIEKVQSMYGSSGTLAPSNVDSLSSRLISHFEKLGFTSKNLGFNIGELRYALSVFKETGDRKGIDLFLRTVKEADIEAGGVGAERLVKEFLPKMISDSKRSARYTSALKKSETFNATSEKWDALDDNFSGIREDIGNAINTFRKEPFFKQRLSKPQIDPETGQPFQEILKGEDTTSFAEQGILNWQKTPEVPSLKNVIDEIVLKLDHQIFDSEIAARSFKAIEQVQTDALKAIQYGIIPDTAATQEVIQKQIIDMLREDMKRVDKWGQMATLKKMFDDKADSYTAFKQQVESNLGTEIGRKLLGDPDKFKSFIQGLNQENFARLAQLTGYGESVTDLLDFIRRNFDEIDVDELPPQLRQTIKTRLKEIDDAGLKIGSSHIQNPKMGFDERLENMVKFSGNASRSLSNRIDEIKEKLPIVEALQNSSARDANMSNLISDVGRGGIASTLAFAATGSPLAAAATGLAVGSASMALSPQRVLNLMRQLSVLKKSQKEAIADYMVDWADNKVPKAAISKGWEKTSRSMLMIAAQPAQKDTRKTRSEIRKKSAQNRDKAHWTSKINEALSSDLTEENYFDVKTSINKLASSPFLLESFSNEMTKVFEQAPDIRKSMKDIIVRKIKIANRIIPKGTEGTAFSDPVPPSDFQLKEFARNLQILNSPSDTILTAMLSGTLTAEMVDVFIEAWPRLYQETAQAALDALSDGKIKRNSLSSNQKLVLSTLLKAPIMNNSEAMRLSATFEEEAKAEQRPPGRGNDMSSTTEASAQGMTYNVRQ